MKEGSVAALVNFDCVDKLSVDCQGTSAELSEAVDEAREFLTSFRWVSSIDEEYLGDFYEGIVGIFLFRITPKLFGIDDFTWVIVGDLPAAYITVEDSPNPAVALDSYIGAMSEWVEAVLEGRGTEGVIPVDAAETNENALALKSRLEFLDERILPDCRGSLSEDRSQ